MSEIPRHEKQAIIWDYYKPRHTHAWNMLVLAWRALDAAPDNVEEMMEEEYHWENFIIRLWLYRIAVKTLARLDHIRNDAEQILFQFDNNFETDGNNGLKAIRDIIEHFDDYAAGEGRGPATREGELDPWRAVSRDRFERSRYVIEKAPAYD